ncbi:hypothetical protein JCM12856_32040 [Spirochaeta dissipatitropha]
MDIRTMPRTCVANPRNDEVIYTPPEGETLLRDMLSNWEQFLHTSFDLDTLVVMAVAHYQFEAIHPFTDGNGRTGRILNILYLMDQELLTLPILYLSRYIVHNKSEYYRRLLSVTRHGEWEAWILFMLRGVNQVSRWTCSMISRIRELMQEISALVQKQLPKIYSYELIQLIFEQPYCRINSLVDKGIARRQTASVYLKQLTGIGVLNEEEFGREKLFVNKRLLQLLTYGKIHE